MQLTNKEQELLSTYQNWLKENNLSSNCNAYFISKTSMLVFQVWNLQKLISETLWIKTNNQEWQFYIKNLGEKFNKYFSLEKILKIEKDFILRAFKEKDITLIMNNKHTCKQENYKKGLRAIFPNLQNLW